MRAASLRLCALFVAAFALAQVRPPAPAAADAAARVAEAERLIARLEALLKAQDRAGLEAELGKVGPAHNALDDEAVRARLHRVVGDVLAHEALGSTRLQAADALAECHDERVWSQLKRVFPAPEVETGLPVHLRAVAAAGKVAASASATPLLDLARKGRDPNLVRAAVEALGGFGWAKNRVHVLGELGGMIPLTDGGAAGGARGAKTSPETAAAWRALKPTLLAALNALTGRNEASLDVWSALLKEHRKKPDALFARAALR